MSKFEERVQRVKKEKPAEPYLARRDGHADLKFVGWLLADAASWRGFDRLDDWQIKQHPKRWKELRLWVTESGSFICERRGCTSIGGEVDRHDAIAVPLSGGSRDVRTPIDGGAAWRIDQVPASAVDVIIDFFGRDGLAKELYDTAGIEDVEQVA